MIEGFRLRLFRSAVPDEPEFLTKPLPGIVVRETVDDDLAMNPMSLSQSSAGRLRRGGAGPRGGAGSPGLPLGPWGGWTLCCGFWDGISQGTSHGTPGCGAGANFGVAARPAWTPPAPVAMDWLQEIEICGDRRSKKLEPALHDLRFQPTLPLNPVKA